ncbi:pirin family protein [Idiomarina piscisalsi]|uniref:pirin family protein n=1 Tax=Idiomarina piscisalsi TaxID=1096243 RepID=UPI001382C4C5|nr:pirin family protein [Idiomarina piscisalsi]MTJ02873.1 pirin family protein [Idiomarina piscisalsi]
MTKTNQHSYSLGMGNSLHIGNGFTGIGFREKEFKGAMDPLALVDHYTMTAPTFGPHPHAGLSAVSILFEDTIGKFHNRDSLGNDFDLEAGDLYWLKAGRGVVHDESPRKGAVVHGLQVFVNLPKRQKRSHPESLHVKSSDMPRIIEKGVNVRVVLGHSNKKEGKQSPATPMTILDGVITPKSQFSHAINAGDNIWCYLVSGTVEVVFGGETHRVTERQALALSGSSEAASDNVTVINSSSSDAHFVLFNAQPIKEDFIQKGPFIMSTEEEITEVEQAYSEGRLGRVG